MTDWEQYEANRDAGIKEDSYEIIDEDEWEEVEDAIALSSAQRKNPYVDKVVEVTYIKEFKAYNFDNFYKEVLYCMEAGIGTRTETRGRKKKEVNNEK